MCIKHNADNIYAHISAIVISAKLNLFIIRHARNGQTI